MSLQIVKAIYPINVDTSVWPTKSYTASMYKEKIYITLVSITQHLLQMHQNIKLKIESNC